MRHHGTDPETSSRTRTSFRNCACCWGLFYTLRHTLRQLPLAKLLFTNGLSYYALVRC